MIRHSAELDALELRYVREIIAPMSYREALDRFAALWAYARELDPRFPGDWRQDLDPDLALARVLNGLPPERD